jgi:hypothetical protein
MSKGCRKLTSFALYQSDTDVGAQFDYNDSGLQFLTSLPNLFRLSLDRIPQLTEQTVIAIASASKHLRHLSLDGNWAIGDETVEALFDCCPSLRSLSLIGCRRVTRRGLFACGPFVERIIGTTPPPALPKWFYLFCGGTLSTKWEGRHAMVEQLANRHALTTMKVKLIDMNHPRYIISMGW